MVTRRSSRPAGLLRMSCGHGYHEIRGLVAFETCGNSGREHMRKKKKRDLHSGKFKGGLGSWGARERWSLAFRYGQGTIATAQLRHALCSERAWRRPNGEMEHPHPCFAYATPSATPPPVHVLVPPWTSFGEQHAKERLRHFDLSSYIVFSHSFVFRPSQLTGLSSPDRV